MILKLPDVWWILIPLFLLPIAFVLWQLWQHRRSPIFVHWLRRLGIILLLLLIALRPSFPGGSAPQGMSNLDAYFVVDLTSSMAAEDYNGGKQRLEGVRQDIKDIAGKMTGARFSVITFSSATYLEMPLTTDTSALVSMASTLQQEITFYSKGSTISQPLDMLKAELEKHHKTQPERQTIVYFFSDGEQTSETKIASFAPIKPLVTGGAVLGYGTSGGGKMKQFSAYDDAQTGYIKDYSTGKFPAPDALSKIDETNLQHIATQTGLMYTHRTAPGAIDTFVRQLSLSKLASEKRDSATYWDAYWLLAILLVGVAGWEFWSLRSVWKDSRKKRTTV